MEFSKDILKKIVDWKIKKKAYNKKYYDKHMMDVRKKACNRAKQRITCEICNVEMNRSSMTLHKKSVAHNKNLMAKAPPTAINK